MYQVTVRYICIGWMNVSFYIAIYQCANLFWHWDTFIPVILSQPLWGHRGDRVQLNHGVSWNSIHNIISLFHGKMTIRRITVRSPLVKPGVMLELPWGVDRYWNSTTFSESWGELKHLTMGWVETLDPSVLLILCTLYHICNNKFYGLDMYLNE